MKVPKSIRRLMTQEEWGTLPWEKQWALKDMAQLRGVDPEEREKALELEVRACRGEDPDALRREQLEWTARHRLKQLKVDYFENIVDQLVSLSRLPHLPPRAARKTSRLINHCRKVEKLHRVYSAVRSWDDLYTADELTQQILFDDDSHPLIGRLQ